jgi:superfamily II DNA or RNA helicase
VSGLDDLVAGASVAGVEASGPVTLVSVTWQGSQAVSVIYRDSANQLHDRLLFRSDEGSFEVQTGTARAWSFDADGHLFRLAAEARRIHLAHLFDPYIALSSSRVDPLPHQIEAVYGEMLPRQPLRFLLADDPGAGKTIMAGLYIKELIIRGDAERILIVAPGSLTAQWQDELADKFGLAFDIVTREMLDRTNPVEAFGEKHRLICRVDQIARRDDLVEKLPQVDWDLVVIDEAHRMSAHFFGDEVQKTKKYVLGEVLGSTTRHLLLMTATPHAGKEEDFQLFLALLDSDRFAGKFRDGVRSVDPSDLMRRMVKEKLLTFDGRPLFPERRANTVTYDLSPHEMALYDEVTEYVREQMNRADRLAQEGQGRRGNTVGFALTMLQRRLASSPEAIFQSLTRRRKRLEQRIIDERQRARAAALGATPQEERLSTLLGDAGDQVDIDLDAWEDLEGAEREDLETEIVDAATAAATVAELQVEIDILKQLEQLARGLRSQGVDAKWVQLSGLLTEASEMFDPNGARRKLLIFTEHKDTLNYLVDRLRTFLGTDEAVVYISGSTPRDERRAIQARFTQEDDCLVLVATDAAGEGINLQRAHLVINYDLPWNPNRIEQRFGRVHRIGQTEVCHMWNLVAAETREAQVYLRLLDKIEQQRQAYRGQVFDVLGDAISGRQLRDLLLQAIRYGDDPVVRDRINVVIDETIGARIRDAIEHPPLAEETMSFADLERVRTEMLEAGAKRLQPHYIRAFFQAALAHLGGTMVEREDGRYQIATVPAAIRQRDRQIGTGAPVLKSYTRITFDRDRVVCPGRPPAELIAPGHPLLGAVIDLIEERHGHVLQQGTVLVDEEDLGTDPRVLVMLEHAIADGRPTRSHPYTVVSRRYEFVEVGRDGGVHARGYAPYLDYRPLTEAEHVMAEKALTDEWLVTDIEAIGTTHAIEVAIPDHLQRVKGRTEARIDATLAAVTDRLTREITYWDHRANRLQLEEEAGYRNARLNAARARDRADRLAERLQVRVNDLEAERQLRALPPTIVGGTLVLPAGALRRASGHGTPPQSTPEQRTRIEQRAVDAVMAAERAAGWDPVDMNAVRRNNPGYDIRSRRVDADGVVADVRFIEVKGRAAGAPTVSVTRNEILTSLNDPDRFILALVAVHEDDTDEVRYLRRPFDGRSEDFVFEVTSVNFEWAAFWSRAVPAQ